MLATALIAAFYIYQLFQDHTTFPGNVWYWLTLNTWIIISVATIIYLLHVAVYQTRRKRWLSIIRNAHVDYLTGLPNQYQLIKDLKHSEHTNLAFLKFNNYNSILNTYGPAVTDGVVKQVAAVLAAFEHPLMQKSGRYYIQQAVFAVLEDQDTSYENIATITKAIVKNIMNTRYQVGDDEYIALNITVGAVRQNEDAFMLANMALQEAESQKLQFYLIDDLQANLPAIYKRDLALTQALLQGIQDRRLVAWFQPIYHARQHTVVKYECLARLLDEKQQVKMSPNVFMPLAHRANLYHMVTRVMVKHALRFAERNEVVVNVNISLSDINNRRTCDYIFHKIKQSSHGHLIHFELLENEAIMESAAIVRFINRLHDLGSRVGMDDLGKGYSNIERLLNLPIDFVKIDRSIMENITQNLEMQQVAKGIVRLAHKKRLKVVAEYCADADLTRLAKDLGVDYLQGYYLGKPAPGPVIDAPATAEANG
ncbi:EAL domain-containing protein [Marinicella meishanensis]|uniref:EAL domain-containing protein n=1 Tax=Marinicella meishanensis TaxID=2873263 RepID=UPI001CBE8F8C|nr:GGDEF domain-containing phosphodiesterase [Marinicella sp. NBU2979]